MRYPKKITKSSAIVIALSVLVVFGGYKILQNHFSEYYLDKGVNVYETRGDINEALKFINRSIKFNDKNDEALRIASNIAVLKISFILDSENLDKVGIDFNSQFETSLSLATKATIVDPEDIRNWNQLANVYSIAIGVIDEAEYKAVLAYEESMKLEPNNPEIPLNQARVYTTAADFISDEYEIYRLSNNANISRKNEFIRIHSLHISNAIKKAEKSLEIDNNYDPARILLSSLYERLGENKKAVEELEKLKGESPEYSVILYEFGLVKYDNDKFENAAIALRAALKSANGEFANARYYLGLSLYSLGEKSAAIEHFEILVANNPLDESANIILNNMENGRNAFIGL